MKIRTCVLVWMLSVALPVVFSGASAIPSALGVSTAWAQQPDAVTALARERFLEGVKAYDAGRYEEARSLFLQAYALKRHPAVLLNLGQAELKSGHVVAGGNHLQQFLREHKTATEAQKSAAKAGVADARRRVGHIIVIVDVDGASVAVDGVGAGRSPLLDPIFAKPGEHRITATLSGKTAAAPVVAKRGSATPVNLSLRALGVQPAPTPVPAPTPSPAPTPAPSGTAPYPAPAPTAPPPGTAPPSGPTPMPMPPPGGQADQGRDNFFSWFANRPIAWVLTGVAGLGLVGTIAFGAAASSADSSADSVSDQILTEVRATDNLPAQWYENGDKVNGQPQPCGSFDDPGTAHPYYSQACSTLRDNIDAYDTDIALMGVSIGLLAGGAAGVVIYYFVDPDNPEKTAGQQGPRIMGAAPVITPSQQGFGIVGTF